MRKSELKDKAATVTLDRVFNKFKPYFDLWMEERKRLGVPDEIEELFVSQNKDGEWQPMKSQTLSTWGVGIWQSLRR